MLKLFEAIFLSSISFSAFAQTCEKTGGINNGSSSGTQITIAKRFGVTPSGPYNQVFVTQGTASFGLQLDLIRCGSLYRAYSSNKNLVGPTLGNPNGDKRTIVTTITSSGVVKIQENVVLNTFGGQGLCSDGSLPPSVATERNTTTWNLPQLTANSTKIRTYSSKCKTPTLDYTWGYVTVVRASGIFTQSNYFPFTTPPNINIDVLSTDQAESSIVFHTISVDAQDSLKIRSPVCKRQSAA